MTAPHADATLDELDREMTVYVETLGDGDELFRIHDPAYQEPFGDYVEMPLEEALEEADGFCCDCFSTVWINNIDGE